MVTAELHDCQSSDRDHEPAFKFAASPVRFAGIYTKCQKGGLPRPYYKTPPHKCHTRARGQSLQVHGSPVRRPVSRSLQVHGSPVRRPVSRNRRQRGRVFARSFCRIKSCDTDCLAHAEQWQTDGLEPRTSARRTGRHLQFGSST